MKAFAIVIKDHPVSEAGFTKLVQSSIDVNNPFTLERWNAITPATVDSTLPYYNIKWNWPQFGKLLDVVTGLTKNPYAGDVQTRIACALSHYTIWDAVVTMREPTWVFEHDAEFINRVDFDTNYIGAPVLGVNDPRGATRKPELYHQMLQKNPSPYQLVPRLDADLSIPHGLAGNSAYFINVRGAKMMLDLVNQYGLWPNDAIMCRQLVPNLSTTRKYYTKVQGLVSTTTI